MFYSWVQALSIVAPMLFLIASRCAQPYRTLLSVASVACMLAAAILAERTWVKVGYLLVAIVYVVLFMNVVMRDRNKARTK